MNATKSSHVLVACMFTIGGCMQTSGSGGSDGSSDDWGDPEADADTDTDTDGETDTDSGSATDDGDPTAELLQTIRGEWHGRIGDNYEFGCLCLTLADDGTVIEPSGITAGFDVTSGDTTVLDVDARQIDILTIVDGSRFHVSDGTVSEDGSLIEGNWHGETYSGFDDPIELDRLPQTCEQRTGWTGAPC